MFFFYVDILFASEIFNYYKTNIFSKHFFFYFGNLGDIFTEHFQVQSYGKLI